MHFKVKKSSWGFLTYWTTFELASSRLNKQRFVQCLENFQFLQSRWPRLRLSLARWHSKSTEGKLLKSFLSFCNLTNLLMSYGKFLILDFNLTLLFRFHYYSLIWSSKLKYLQNFLLLALALLTTHKIDISEALRELSHFLIHFADFVDWPTCAKAFIWTRSMKKKMEIEIDFRSFYLKFMHAWFRSSKWKLFFNEQILFYFF